MDSLIQKLTSRKFWMALAAFLGSIAATIAGLASASEGIAIAGIAAGALSAAIYAACESGVDKARASANTTSTETKVSASSTGAAANEVVSAVLAPSDSEQK